MPKTTSVSIGDDLADFIAGQVRTGRYGSARDVVQAGLRLLEEHEAKVKALQDALDLGERSGPPTSFDFEAFIADKRAAYATR